MMPIMTVMVMMLMLLLMINKVMGIPIIDTGDPAPTQTPPIHNCLLYIY